ncbi:MAG: hypothetical protein E7224_05495 [Clostridiales bacterium]|nr:hypothetical protein [Clostridiales bacterium]
MKRDLKNSLNREKEQNPPRSGPLKPEDIDPRSMENLQDTVAHYSQKSESELFMDLKRFQEAGVMEPAALYDVAKRIAPMLDPMQQQRLRSILRELGL